MKQIKLKIYNFGNISEIATFGKNQHDAVKCMKMLNDELVRDYSRLPENIFYYLDYKIKDRQCVYVDHTTGQMYPNDAAYMKKISDCLSLIELIK